MELVLAAMVITAVAIMDAGAGVAAGVACFVSLGALWARRRLRLDRPTIRRT